MFALFSTKTTSMTSGTDVQSSGEDREAIRTPAVTTGNPIPREAAARSAGARSRPLVPGFVGYIRFIDPSDGPGRTYRFRLDFSGESSKERI